MLSNKLLSSVNSSSGPLPEPSMILEFNTSLGDGTTTIGIPLAAGTVNVSVDWGDGNIEPFTTNGYKLHTYSTGGIYTVKISGTLTAYGLSTATHNNKITKCTSFGQLGITKLTYAFYNAVNLTNVPSVLPSTVTILGDEYSISTGSTTGVTSGSGCFGGCSSLNDPNISLWNTANVTKMDGVFALASSFNQPLNSWNVSNVTSMNTMFARAYAFDQPLNSWNVSNVTSMIGMFSGITVPSVATYTKFNQNISSWDVSKVTDMSYMFLCNNIFNQNISSWNTSGVKLSSGMQSMFYLATGFNQNLNSWSVGPIGGRPTNFNALNNGFLTENHPLWGNYPGFTTSGTFSFVNTFLGTKSVSASLLQVGDILLAFSYRDGNTSPPTLPAGWTEVAPIYGTFNSPSSIRVAYFIATGTTNSSTWTNATTTIIAVYRGSFDASKIVTIGGTALGSTTTAIYPQNSAYRSLARTIAFVGGRDTAPTLTTAPTGLALRRSYADATNEAALFDSANLDSGFFGQTVSIGSAGTTLTVVVRLPNVIVPV